MELLSTVDQWIDKTRDRIAKELQIPLIDDLGINMTSELLHAWRWTDGPLREALENVLSRDPEDTAARLVTLSAYYTLMTFGILEEEGVDVKREEFRRQLAYFVRLRDTGHCTTLRDIRWEITNACSIGDYQRALALCSQLQSLIPPIDQHFLIGRLHFLIALAELDEPLARWDIPIGPKPDGLRGLYHDMYGIFPYLVGVKKRNTMATISADQRDHLRDAIKHLERVRSAQDRTAAPFMLARSYADIGDDHNATTTYQWILNNHKELIAAGAREAGPVWNDLATKDILPDLYECLVSTNEREGAIEKAITATTAWIDAFPDQPGTYMRLARLHQSKGDFRAAYDWLRKEADRNPILSEDPNVSIALALGSIAMTANIEDALAKIATVHTEEIRRIADLLVEYWPAYECLSAESQERWATGTWLRSTVPHSPGLAAHCFFWVVERELRTTLIDTFGATVTPAILNTAEKEAGYLQRYLQGYGGLTFGQRLTVIKLSTRSRDPLFAAFGQWLNREHSSLGAGLQRLGLDEMIELRNRESHANLLTINANDMAIVARKCRGLLNLLHTPKSI